VAIQKQGTVGGGSDFDVVLKEYYEGPVREHLNNSIPILKYVEKSKRKWSGRRVVFPIHLRRNHGVGARAETGTLPTAGRQEYVESKIKSKFMYGRIELTGVVIAASQGDKGSFASALRTEVEGLRRDLRVDFNRQVWGNSLSGASGNTAILAQINDTDAAIDTVTTADVEVTVDNPGSRYLKKGMLLNAGTTGELVAAVKPIKITAVNSTTSINVQRQASSGTVDLDNDDFLVRGDENGNSFDSEITGLGFMVSDSDDDLQEVNTGNNPEWSANVLSNSGVNRPLSLELMQLAIDTTDEVAGSEPNLVMGHHSIRREYINLLTSDVRYSPEQLKGGFQKLTYAGGTNPMPIEFDRMAPYNKLFFLNTKDIKLYVMKDWAWADRDGSSFSRKLDSDSWEAFMCWYGNMGLERRFSQTLLSDIEVSNLIF
tara:strand:+ start:50 stop:1336 length:1287 start_codon:yes stop_codon:yes gene_type:complete